MQRYPCNVQLAVFSGPFPLSNSRVPSWDIHRSGCFDGSSGDWRSGLEMTIKVFDELHETLIDEAWELYYGAFQELNALAVQRHLMFRDEFDVVMRDARVKK